MTDKKVYVIETPKEIFWSDCKMDAQYAHVDFLYRDRARYKEVTPLKFRNMTQTTKKKVIHLEET